eukprot:tig00000903_g5505.t1
MSSNCHSCPLHWIEKLGLKPHPEGGFYREHYKASLKVSAKLGGSTEERTACTSIYYLLNSKQFSCFHKIKSDETWHHYEGATAVVYVIDPESGQLSALRLGRGEHDSLCVTVPAGCWFACRVEQPYSFALMGCTVAPGFEFSDLTMAKRADLLAAFPRHAVIITALTRA